MIFSNRIKNCFTLISIYILLTFNYFLVLSKTFSYSGYNIDFFEIIKLITSVIMFLIALFMYVKIKDDFYRIVYSCYLILIYMGQSISYIFRDTYLILLFYLTIPLVLLFIADIFDINNKHIKTIKLKLNDKYTLIVFYLVVIFMILPFLKYYRIISLKNLFLQDVYDTRKLFKEYDRGILAYLLSPITRVMLPFFGIYSIKSKKKFIFLSSIFFLLLMFLLNGALKSIFIGFFASIFFYFGDIRHKEKNFLKVFNITIFFSILEYLFFSSYNITDYIRRLIFVPPSLFKIYYDYFYNNHTYFLHSRMAKLLGINTYSGSVSVFVGETVIGKSGLNANIGIFGEGYLSFGLMGVILSSLFFIIVVIYVKRLHIQYSYFGIFFVYIYIINTSFIEPLLLTHGLLAYLLFATFIIPREN